MQEQRFQCGSATANRGAVGEPALWRERTPPCGAMNLGRQVNERLSEERVSWHLCWPVLCMPRDLARAGGSLGQLTFKGGATWCPATGSHCCRDSWSSLLLFMLSA